MKNNGKMGTIDYFGNELKVKPYLTYDEIDGIVKQVIRYDDWAEREQALDLMLIHYATDMSEADIEKADVQAMVRNGVIENVKQEVKNFYQVKEAIEYTQSVARAMEKIAKEIVPVLGELEKKAKAYGTKPSKK